MKEEGYDLIKELANGLAIDKHNLDEEFTRAPELFYKVKNLHTRAQLDQGSIKVDIENAEADLYIQFRQQADEENEKLVEAGEKPEKITDTAINRKVNASKRIRKLQLSLREATEQVG